MDTIASKRQELTDLLKEINMSATYSEKIIAAFDEWTHNNAVSFEIPFIKESIYAGASNQTRTIMLFLLLSLVEYENGAWSPFPRNIFIDTISDFSAFVRFYKKATGEEGYGKYLWPMHYAEARIFRLGAFHYEIISEPDKKRVEMHIPEGAELTPQSLGDSLKIKDSFFGKYLPEWKDIPVECHSWMLSPALKECLPQGSRILWFQSMFELFGTDPDSNFYLQFVFDLEYFQWCNGYDLTKLRENTSLQRNLKKYVLNGGKPGMGLGYLKFHEAI